MTDLQPRPDPERLPDTIRGGEEEIPFDTRLRDLLFFLAKLTLDGFVDVVLAPLAVVAFLADGVSGRTGRNGYFYRVMRVGERVDLWLNLYGPASAKVEESEVDGDLVNAGRRGADTLLHDLEQRARKQARDLRGRTDGVRRDTDRP